MCGDSCDDEEEAERWLKSRSRTSTRSTTATSMRSRISRSTSRTASSSCSSALRLRQDDRAAHGRRARGHLRRDDLDRRPGRQRPHPEGARHRDGLPELRALPAPDRRPRTSRSACGCARRRRSEIDERVDWAAKLLDLTPYLDRRPKELSGGQRQRVAMGRAIVREPQVFLMDEPLSNLDAKLRVQMRAEIAKLQHELGTTTIYVTHDQVEAMTMGDRVAVMSQGVLQQVDTPQRLYDVPANLFVAGFIGTPPMNLIEARCVAERTRRRSVLGGERLAAVRRDAARTTRAPRLDGREPSSSASAPRTLSRPASGPTCRRSRRASSCSRRSARETIAYFTDRRRRRAARRGSRRDEARRKRTGERHRARPNLVATFPPHIQLSGSTTLPSRSTSPTCTSSTRRRVRRCASARPSRSLWPPRSSRSLAGAAAVRRAGRAALRARPLAALSQPPSYAPIASQRIYFVMTDRYANGDPSNDRGGLSGGRVDDRLRPGRHRLLPRRRLQGADRRLHRPATGSRGSRPRLHRDLGDAARRQQ